jgi:hypothetical protein
MGSTWRTSRKPQQSILILSTRRQAPRIAPSLKNSGLWAWMEPTVASTIEVHGNSVAAAQDHADAFSGQGLIPP